MPQQENQRKFSNVSGELSQTIEDKHHKIMRAVPATILLVLSAASWFMYFNFYYEWNSERAVHWLPLSVLLTISTVTIIWLQNKWFIPKNISPFNLWIFGITIIGGSISFFLPLAIADNFSKDGEGTALRQMLIYSTGGLLGVITLGETRRKNDQEKSKNENDHTRQVHAERRSRYTKAVEQLANEKAAVRLGGIYTLVGLVDEWLTDDTLKAEEQQKEGQFIIKNLCAYIRSPFPHAELRTLFKRANSEESIPEEDRDEFLKKRAQFREEQDIRCTILAEITNRLSSEKMKTENGKQAPQKGPWSDFTYDFSGSYFLYNVDFRNVVANYPINFSHSIFGQVVSFHNSIFEEGAFFGGAKFEDSSSFIDTNFKKSSSFYGAKFKGNVSFKKSTFEGTANFYDAVFENISSFKSTRFKGKADFKDANFTGHTNFSGTTFKEEAIFSGANFIKNKTSSAVNSPIATADFNGATFGNTTDFRDAYFEGFANFSKATFGDDVNFISATFKVFDGFADFTDATFDKSVSFLSSTFIGPTGFYGARFISKEPNFTLQKLSSLVARFSCSVTPESYIFNVSPHSPYKIKLGESELNGKKFTIPEGTTLFEPGPWDSENQYYKNMSNPAVAVNTQGTILQKINLLFP